METQLKRSGNVNRCKSLAFIGSTIEAIAQNSEVKQYMLDVVDSTQMPEDNPEIEQNIPLNRSDIA